MKELALEFIELLLAFGIGYYSTKWEKYITSISMWLAMLIIMITIKYMGE